MTIVAREDKRNLEWRDNNIGSSLLQKMGWKEGESLGKRSKTTHALRAIKRQDGLGIGAKIASEGGNSESAKEFCDVLASLRSHHTVSTTEKDEDNDDTDDVDARKKKEKKEKRRAKKKKKEKKHSKKSLSLAQNKVTAGHAKKMRHAKFGAKSADELACIFGSKDVVVSGAVDGNGL